MAEIMSLVDIRIFLLFTSVLCMDASIVCCLQKCI